MENAYTFDVKEKEYIDGAQQELSRRVKYVLEVNKLQGRYFVSPKGDGFVLEEAARAAVSSFNAAKVPENSASNGSPITPVQSAPPLMSDARPPS
jgi:hypothetical protein